MLKKWTKTFFLLSSFAPFMITFLMTAKAREQTEESSCDLVTTRGIHSHVVQLEGKNCWVKPRLPTFWSDKRTRNYCEQENEKQIVEIFQVIKSMSMMFRLDWNRFSIPLFCWNLILYLSMFVSTPISPEAIKLQTAVAF